MARLINTILVDDESMCIENLEFYLAQCCPRLRVVGSATTIRETRALLERFNVHLAFLDIQLLKETTLDVLPMFRDAGCSIVFVTAYEQFALKAFQASALDYIVKPLMGDEITRCYEKVVRYWDGASEMLRPKAKEIIIREAQVLLKLDPAQILYLTASGFYTRVYFDQGGQEKSVLVTKPINHVLREWENPDLLRVHRSHVVNAERITSVKKAGPNIVVMIGATEIPVAKRRSADFLRAYQPRRA